MKQTTSFSVKLVVFGDYFEVYKYTLPILENFRKPQKPKKMEQEKKALEESKKKGRFASSIGRTRNTVRRLISANFKGGAKFLTLTFAENLQDVRIANTCFKAFIRDLRHYFLSQGNNPDDFKYLAVIEFQKRGAIHYHIIMQSPFVPESILKIAWSYGFFKINQTSHVENIGAYVSKYLYKDVDDPRLRGKRAYQYSRNLVRPLEITEKNTIRVFLSNVKKLSQVLKKSTFDNEYTGRIYYRMYKRADKG